MTAPNNSGCFPDNPPWRRPQPSAARSDPGVLPELLKFADVAPRPVRWCWPGRIPFGKPTLLAGAASVGKSALACDLAARFSAGLPWPDAAPPPTTPTPPPRRPGQSAAPPRVPPRDPVPPSAAAPSDGPSAAPLRAIPESPCLRVLAPALHPPLVPPPGTPGCVLFFASRPDHADVICPRLCAAGAALQRIVAAIDFTPAAIEHALDRFQDLRCSCRPGQGQPLPPGLIVVDPLAPAANPAHAAAVLDMLLYFTWVTDAALLITMPLRHGRAPALQRLPDRLNLPARAPCILIASRDHRDENPDPARRLLIPLKNRLAPLAPPLAFHLQPNALDWSPHTPSADALEAILAAPPPPHGPNPVHLEKCAQWLYDQLTPQARPAAEVIAAAAPAGFSSSTLYRAKAILNVKSRRNRACQWTWRLEHTDFDSFLQKQDRLLDSLDG